MGAFVVDDEAEFDGGFSSCLLTPPEWAVRTDPFDPSGLVSTAGLYQRSASGIKRSGYAMSTSGTPGGTTSPSL